MPQSISLAAFIFGAILTLIAMGITFELFSAKISEKVDKNWRAFALISGLVLILVGILNPFEKSNAISSAPTAVPPSQVSIASSPTQVSPTPAPQTPLSSTSAPIPLIPTSLAPVTQQPTLTPAATAPKDRRTILRNYESIYIQSGWCGLWDYLIKEGGVSGECPKPRYDQVSDSDVEIVDKFVAKKAGYIIGFVVQADAEIDINYLNCVAFDSTNLAVKYKTRNNRYIDKNPRGWIATDVSIQGPFTIYLYCNDVSWPNP